MANDIVRKIFTQMGIIMDAKSANNAAQVIENLKKNVVRLAEAYATMKGVQAIVEMVDDTAKLGAEVLKLSQRFGIATDQLQKFQFAAEQSLVSNEEFTFSLRFLERNAYEATQGNKEAIRNFYRLGVSVKDSSGKIKPASEILLDVAEAMKGINSENERTAIAQALFGRAGYKMIPMLLQGRDGIIAQGKAAEELGGIMDKDLISKSLEYVQLQKQIQFALQGVKNRISSVLIPAMSKGMEWLVKWVKSNRELIDELVPFTKHVLDVAFAIGEMVKWVAEAVYWVVKSTAEFIAGKKWALEFALAIGALAVAFSSPLLAILGLIVGLGVLIEDFQMWQKYGAGADTLFGSFLIFLRRFSEEAKKNGNWGMFGTMADDILTVVHNWTNFSLMVKEDVNQISYLVEKILLLGKFLFNVSDTVARATSFANFVGPGFGIAARTIQSLWAGSAEARRSDYINTLNLEHHTMVSITGSPSGLPYHANSDEIVRKIEESNENAHKRAFAHFGRR